MTLYQSIRHGLVLQAGHNDRVVKLMHATDALASTPTGRTLLANTRNAANPVRLYSPQVYVNDMERQFRIPPGTTRGFHHEGDIHLNEQYFTDAKLGASILGHELSHRATWPAADRAADERAAKVVAAQILTELGA